MAGTRIGRWLTDSTCSFNRVLALLGYTVLLIVNVMAIILTWVAPNIFENGNGLSINGSQTVLEFTFSAMNFPAAITLTVWYSVCIVLVYGCIQFISLNHFNPTRLIITSGIYFLGWLIIFISNIALIPTSVSSGPWGWAFCGFSLIASGVLIVHGFLCRRKLRHSCHHGVWVNPPTAAEDGCGCQHACQQHTGIAMRAPSSVYPDGFVVGHPEPSIVYSPQAPVEVPTYQKTAEVESDHDSLKKGTQFSAVTTEFPVEKDI